MDARSVLGQDAPPGPAAKENDTKQTEPSTAVFLDTMSAHSRATTKGMDAVPARHERCRANRQDAGAVGDGPQQNRERSEHRCGPRADRLVHSKWCPLDYQPVTLQARLRETFPADDLDDAIAL